MCGIRDIFRLRQSGRDGASDAPVTIGERLPLEVFEVALEVAGGLETREDQ